MLLAPSPSAADTQSDRHRQFNDQLIQVLSERDTAAARLFAAGVAASDRGDYAGAAAFYQSVRERAPWFVHATRRVGSMEMLMDHRDAALELARSAVQTDSSKENLAFLADAIARVKEGETLTDQERFQAASAADAALDKDSTDIDIIFTACEVALRSGEPDLLARSFGLLHRHMVDEEPAHYLMAIYAGETHQYSVARTELDRARQLGLSKESYAGLLPYTRPPALETIGESAAWVGAFWVVAFIVLLALGWVLSQLTLARSAQIPSSREARVGGVDALVRRVYALVLNATCVYYYLSLPILLVAVIALVLGSVYAFSRAGHIPVKLLVLVVIVGWITVSAILKSVFVRARQHDPGDKLDLADHPRLRQILDQVASVIGTRTVDNVYITPGAEMAVMERGGSMNPLRRGASRERCLILGADVLDGMRLGWFKAILGHEYGHFSNRDTAGGQFALAVRRSLYTMAYGIASGGAAAWYNPAWLFLRGFHRVFLVVSQGASRLQEMLADRWAIFAYGSEAFASGLRHVVEKAVHHDVHTQATLKEVIEQKLPLANLYAYVPHTEGAQEAEAKGVEYALAAKATAFDSHPPPADRMRWALAMNAPNSHPSPDDEAEAWCLFSDRLQIERRLTDGIREVIHQRYGIEIPAEQGVEHRADESSAPQPEPGASPA